MVPLLRNADFDGALEVALRKVDEAATPEHAASLERARQLNAVAGARRRAHRVPRPEWLGVHQLAAVRQGPGLPRRPLDPHAGPAARPDRGVRGDGHGRWHVAARPDHGDARSREPRAPLVPRGDGAARPESQGRRRRGPGQGRRDGGSATGAGTRAARSGRPRRSRSRSSARWAPAKTSGYIKPDDLPKFGTSVADFDKALERHVVAARLVCGGTQQGHDALGRARRARHRGRGRRARRRVGTSRSRGSC